MDRFSRRGVGARLAAAAALCMALAGVPQAARASGVDTVRGFYGVLLNTMQNGPTLGQQGRYAQLAPVIQQDFNVGFMTRLAIGPDWNSLTPAQQQQVAAAFTRYIAAVYAERFDNYSGEQLQVIGEQPTAAGVIVQTRIVKSNGEPVNLNYLMVQNGGYWQIADVYLNGTISELATRRSEFSSILRSQGINGLIAALNNKAYTLVPSRS
ncbi:MAG: ABC transporter substrate-binding protein [Alphaproteobacteria bacterium]|nr:ABC transporter substrate-binding protein [Alphaproteobacteria bacterium]MBV9863437.1 ABC transporter substrate-binding protein [Alphaproteobacteria bacterium]